VRQHGIGLGRLPRAGVLALIRRMAAGATAGRKSASASTSARTTATAPRRWSGSRPCAGRAMTARRASRSCCPRKP